MVVGCGSGVIGGNGGNGCSVASVCGVGMCNERDKA